MKKLVFVLVLFSVSTFLYACSSGGNGSATRGKTVKTGTVNNLTVTLATADGVIKDGANDFTLSFTDASGKPVDVGAVSVNFHMPAMGTMAVMNDSATLTTSGTPGVYNGKVKLQMAGEWQTQIAYEGAAGKGKTVLPIVAQ
jgi:nitrogen fixation protein FixH